MGNQAWLVAVPTGDALPESATVVAEALYMLTGPKRGADFSACDRNALLWGTQIFSFSNCSSGSITLTPGSEAEAMGQTSLSHALTRDPLVSGNTCPSAMSN